MSVADCGILRRAFHAVGGCETYRHTVANSVALAAYPRSPNKRLRNLSSNADQVVSFNRPSELCESNGNALYNLLSNARPSEIPL